MTRLTAQARDAPSEQRKGTRRARTDLSGVPEPEVAAREGHSVDVLLKIYAKCVDVQKKPQRPVQIALQAAERCSRPRPLRSAML
ncbi:hypothetical protein [Streptomyces sp. R41]|uniref:Integrase n=1 Tax=Streptomyces sp. R41 TaxID=3238632 RepID=A0AB39RXR5_9ACTN